eukprot:TRINITY_DN33132_c0_g1_i1.p1 TRINITY_DN33132_c0_g1~~TRINITY_DN33132_c0_g1_i1.p1  ORF type:complete len:252 (+),score=25.43 TRINITY_DN33132_c0_g1_i1:204-959(+)
MSSYSSKLALREANALVNKVVLYPPHQQLALVDALISTPDELLYEMDINFIPTKEIFCSAIVNGNLQVAAILMDKTPDPETLIFLVVEGLSLFQKYQTRNHEIFELLIHHLITCHETKNNSIIKKIDKMDFFELLRNCNGACINNLMELEARRNNSFVSSKMYQAYKVTLSFICDRPLKRAIEKYEPDTIRSLVKYRLLPDYYYEYISSPPKIALEHGYPDLAAYILQLNIPAHDKELELFFEYTDRKTHV